jgi:hypothetical protein
MAFHSMSAGCATITISEHAKTSDPGTVSAQRFEDMFGSWRAANKRCKHTDRENAYLEDLETFVCASVPHCQWATENTRSVHCGIPPVPGPITSCRHTATPEEILQAPGKGSRPFRGQGWFQRTSATRDVLLLPFIPPDCEIWQQVTLGKATAHGLLPKVELKGSQGALKQV